MTITETIIAEAKLAAKITTTAYDSQVRRLLETALLDLGVAGVVVPEEESGLITQAAITYFLLNFGSPADYDKLLASYKEQKAQLRTCTGFTNWGDGS
jgi:hypothetical protein